MDAAQGFVALVSALPNRAANAVFKPTLYERSGEFPRTGFLGRLVNRGCLLHGVQSIDLAYHIPNPLPRCSVRIPNCLLWGAAGELRDSSPRRNYPLNCRGRGPPRAP